MRFYTRQESDEWLSGRGRKLPNENASSCYTVGYPVRPYEYQYNARWIATSLTYREPALLLITEWGIWSENWHLYYKLRQSYGDHRLLHEAPGHLFLDFESEDLASFLQVAMLNGWGGYVLTGANYVNLFFSHDEYINFYADHDSNLTDVREAFKDDPQKPG